MREIVYKEKSPAPKTHFCLSKTNRLKTEIRIILHRRKKKMRENKFRQTKSVFCLVFFAILSLLVLPAFVEAQTNPEYRAYWAETFNTQMGTRAEIDRIVDAAVKSNANGIFAQVRRRGDSWYLETKEPLTQVAGVGEPDAMGKWTFDPLKYLIDQAHARNIEVHAYVIVGTIYNAHPTITGVPKDANHVFNQHFWDKTATAPYSDSRQWSTRSLPHNLDATTTFNGQRYGAEWYVDLGHPDAAAYTVDILTHLVKNYDIDGLHLDRIRYPEAPIDRVSGKPLGINTGYNETSVNRFKARYGNQATYYQTSDIGTVVNTATQSKITAADVGYPKTNDPLWNDWRRQQVTNVVRRIYLNATAIKPNIKVSAALICFFTGPTGSGGWKNTEAYYRVFQDWQAWTQEGTLDIIAPMIYKQEHTASVRAQYDDWLAYSKKLAKDNNRHSMPGLGIYLNGVEGSLLQTRRALARPPYDTGNTAADGVIFYALGNTLPGNLSGNSTSVAVTANPFSYPIPNISTPKRTNADFFASLQTGASVNGATRFESAALAPLFPTVVPVPEMSWKSQPTEGYVKGFAKRANASPLDAATVIITNLNTGSTRTTVTDGSGFYGGLKLTPGEYFIKAVLNNETLYSGVAQVSAGEVTTADLQPDTIAPETSDFLNPSAPNGSNGWYTTDVSVSLSASDNRSGVAATEYSLDGTNWTPYTSSVLISDEGTTTVSYGSTDRAGNHETVKSVTVKIDKTKPTTSASVEPAAPNGANDWYTSNATISLSSADNTSGIATTEYSIDGGTTWLLYTNSFSITNEGVTTVKYHSTDNAGNVETAKNITVQIDKTAPTTSASINPAAPNGANGWYTKDVAVNLSATDNSSGVVAVEYSIDDGASWLPYADGFSISNEGVTTVKYRSTDSAGNRETVNSVTVQIDKTAPATSASVAPSAPNGSNGWYKTDVTISLSSADSRSGIAATEYSIDGGANWLPYAKSFSISNEGITTVQYRSTDNAGNAETAKNITVQIDKTAPTTSASIDPNIPNGANGWYTKDVTINLSATDNISGVAAVEYSINGAGWLPYTNGFSITAEGVTNIRYRSTDRAGNVEAIKTLTVQIDKSAPTITLTANPSRLWAPNGKPVTVQISGKASDAVSGLASVSYVVTDEYGASLNIPTRTLSGTSLNWTDSIDLEASRRGDDLDGRIYHVVATITDAAGNTSTATVDIVVPHDQRKH